MRAWRTPGTALALDAELQIHGSEHFSRMVQPWSCTAVPVPRPDHRRPARRSRPDRRITGGHPQALALVRATVVAVESHLALMRLTGAGGGNGAAAFRGWRCSASNGRAGWSPTSSGTCARPR